MSVSTTRAATPVCISVEGGSVIGFKDGQAGVKQLTLGYYDDVKTLSDLVTAKNLSNQSFGSIALNGAAKLPCRRDTQPSNRTLVRQDEHGAEAAVDLRSPLVHLLKLCSPANPFGGTKSGHGPAGSVLFARDAQPLAAFRTPALQDEAPVFRGHSDEKSVRPFAPTRVGLKRTLAFHDRPSYEIEPTMLANAFRECQSFEPVLQSASFIRPSPALATP
jgi:hypothetical protein